MQFLKNIFGSSEDPNASELKMDWEPLNHMDQLNAIKTVSMEKPVLIFKHSTRCSVSRMALKQFEREFDFPQRVTPYFLDLLAFREISDAIVTGFGVQHQSPQLILIKEGKAIYDASHSAIVAADLKTKL
ncbi:bacillithiol system redox-active protein YtxJ [Flavobacterium crassostreae]|uniref:General stress protein n=1 Tax=Flavobacterium crassostreae TaxID=1763534 RepID=A0A1B9E9Y4_9FLAO|nr:bacillithiol system redox-active protein YtxJ [Flavobacterium crassostreae]OCB78770.1 general stress protein [Flavobacterium crassostreae]